MKKISEITRSEKDIVAKHKPNCYGHFIETNNLKDWASDIVKELGQEYDKEVKFLGHLVANESYRTELIQTYKEKVIKTLANISFLKEAFELKEKL